MPLRLSSSTGDLQLPHPRASGPCRCPVCDCRQTSLHVALAVSISRTTTVTHASPLYKFICRRPGAHRYETGTERSLRTFTLGLQRLEFQSKDKGEQQAGKGEQPPHHVHAFDANERKMRQLAASLLALVTAGAQEDQTCVEMTRKRKRSRSREPEVKVVKDERASKLELLKSRYKQRKLVEVPDEGSETD